MSGTTTVIEDEVAADRAGDRAAVRRGWILRLAAVLPAAGGLALIASSLILERVAFLAVGASSGIADPQVALRQPLFVAIGGIGLLASFIGYPIWSIWLGGRLLRMADAI